MPKSLKDFVDAALETVREVDPEWVLERAEADGYLILDVREPEEYAAGHVRGAVNVPRGFLEVRFDHDHYKRDPSLADRGLKIVCYCGGGHRSALAAKTLSEMGLSDPLSMRGGWTEWTTRGYLITVESNEHAK